MTSKLICLILIYTVVNSCNTNSNNERMFGQSKQRAKVVYSDKTAVFTTKNVMINNLLITRVYHDIDSTWQFFDSVSTNSNENLMIVALGQILKKDSTIESIMNLQNGYFASRKAKNGKWIIEKIPQEQNE